MKGKFSETIGITCVDLGGLEQEYRRRHLTEDYTLFMVALTLTCFPLLAMALHDFRFLGDSTAAYLLLSARCALLGWAALLALFLHSVENPGRFDRWVFTWVIPTAALVLCINLSRPAGYLNGFVLDILLILMMMLTTGTGWPLRAVPPALYTLGSLSVLWLWKQPASLTPLATITVSLLLALAGGYVLAGRIENYRRNQFLAQNREAKARRELEASLKELREAKAQVATLSGLLPICSNCKKVRDDQGYWQQIESYLSRHSDARFSHGLCPECLEALYPEYYDDREQKAVVGRAKPLVVKKSQTHIRTAEYHKIAVRDEGAFSDTAPHPEKAGAVAPISLFRRRRSPWPRHRFPFGNCRKRASSIPRPLVL